MESTDRKRILISVDWFPPAFRAGGPIRSTGNLAEFLTGHHDIWVVTGNRDLGSDEPVVDEPNTWLERDTAFGSYHVWYGEALNRSTWTQILAHVQPDVVHLNSLYSKAFTLLPLRLLRPSNRAKVVLAPRGMLGAAALGIKPLKKSLFLIAARTFGWMDRVLWHASTLEEQREIKNVFPAAAILVAQNLPSSLPPANPPRPEDAWRIVMVGRIHRVKNLAFGLKSLLEAPSARPIEVDFIGPVEDESYASELQAIAAASADAKVRFLGGIPPTELRPHFQSAHYLLSSTTQENFGHSIVEAWAHGCPVLISDRTPWRDLEAKGIGWDWALDQETWREGLTQALALNPEQWTEKSEASRAFFSDHVRSAESERANLALFE
jgi:glycosyltransferase involved in cell wall biosynthesis